MSDLIELLHSLNDTDLESLTNKGLLRRAYKDLAKDPKITIHLATNSLEAKWEEFTIAIPENGPAQACCTCSAIDICRHILTAILYIKKEQKKLAVDVDKKDFSQFSNYDITTLTKWADKKTLQQALKIATHQKIDIIEDKVLLLRFLDSKVECRLLAGSGLDGAIATCSQKDQPKFILAAVIAWQRKQGILWELEKKIEIVPEPKGAPRSRSEVLQVTKSLLEETLGAGLAHLTSLRQQRFTTLSQVVIGVNLPRLALELKAIADEIDLIVKQNAQAQQRRLLRMMSYSYALACALEDKRAIVRTDLIGNFRTQYETIGTIELAGVAAYPWKSKSGYQGVTLLFWDEPGSQWYSWSHIRKEVFSRDNVDIKQCAIPWQGTVSAVATSKEYFRLMFARKNYQNRLSSSEETRYISISKVNPSRLNFGTKLFDNWQRLYEYMQSIVSFGLYRSNPLDWIVVLRPHCCAEKGFNEIEQCFYWRILDQEENAISLEIPFREETINCIEFLEKWSPQSNSLAIVAKVIFREKTIYCYPYSILNQELDEQKVFHLMFDSPSCEKKAVKKLDSKKMEETEEQDDCLLLQQLQDSILHLAETGYVHSKLKREFATLIASLEQTHLKILSHLLAKLQKTKDPALLLQLGLV